MDVDSSRGGTEKLNELEFLTYWKMSVFEEDSELDILKRRWKQNMERNLRSLEEGFGLTTFDFEY